MRIPEKAPTFEEMLETGVADVVRLRAILQADVGAVVEGRYRHWDTLRHLKPPEGLSHREWWAALKLARSKLWRPIPLKDKTGNNFKFAMPDEAWAMATRIDQNAGGSIAISEQVTNPETRDRYIVNSLIEEAINSSQLEGAATTTPVAREMIRTGRKPRDTSEQMILNNYVTMRDLCSVKDQALTPALVLEIHARMTKGTMPADQIGRWRKDDTEYRVVSDEKDQVLHYPPAATELGERMDHMCSFANGDSKGAFIHPVVRAILLHFWLAHDHPFIDGNGRTARALFYWSMLRSGYWLAEYLSISTILKRAPSKYARAFLYTETDENDLTYFIMHQLLVITRAIEQLQEYLGKKAAEIRKVERLIKKSVLFNHRQLALLGHALRHPDAVYTIRSHLRSHNVVYETARTDLLDLAERGLVLKGQIGNAYHFTPPDDLAQRLADLK